MIHKDCLYLFFERWNKKW